MLIPLVVHNRCRPDTDLTAYSSGTAAHLPLTYIPSISCKVISAAPGLTDLGACASTASSTVASCSNYHGLQRQIHAWQSGESLAPSTSPRQDVDAGGCMNGRLGVIGGYLELINTAVPVVLGLQCNRLGYLTALI